MPDGQHRRGRPGRNAPRSPRRGAPLVALVCGIALTAAALAWALLRPGPPALPASAAADVTRSAGTSPSAAPDPSAASATSVTTAGPSPVSTTLPGVGTALGAQVPADSTQVLVAYGDGADDSAVTAVLYQKTADGGWTGADSWSGHAARDGWALKKSEGDLRTPVGVFGLTDAGGREPNPGSALPYDHSAAFVDTGRGFDGESLADAFDYVIAVDYNRTPGTSPLVETYPLGAARGGGVWLHVDHGGPTHGCVSLPRAAMVYLLRTLKPQDHPVIVMGDRADLAAMAAAPSASAASHHASIDGQSP
jgi:L,D-peptidoglycan transpeptidase YkuD (ErfK/YbiS/YcfS/YnhG family)